MTKEDYAKKAYQWAKALKLLDPSIILILCGENGVSSWDSHILKECIKSDSHALDKGAPKNLIDMHSIHTYTTSEDPIKNALAPLSAERAIEVCSSLIDLARIENGVPSKIPRQTICFDEWNVRSLDLKSILTITINVYTGLGPQPRPRRIRRGRTLHPL